MGEVFERERPSVAEVFEGARRGKRAKTPPERFFKKLAGPDRGWSLQRHAAV